MLCKLNPLTSFEDLEGYFFESASTAALATASIAPATVINFPAFSKFFPIVHTDFSDTYCDVILDKGVKTKEAWNCCATF